MDVIDGRSQKQGPHSDRIPVTAADMWHHIKACSLADLARHEDGIDSRAPGRGIRECEDIHARIL